MENIKNLKFNSDKEFFIKNDDMSNNIDFSKYTNKKLNIKGELNKHNLYGYLEFPVLTEEDDKKYNKYLKDLNSIFFSNNEDKKKLEKEKRR